MDGPRQTEELEVYETLNANRSSFADLQGVIAHYLLSLPGLEFLVGDKVPVGVLP